MLILSQNLFLYIVIVRRNESWEIRLSERFAADCRHKPAERIECDGACQGG